MSKIESPRSPRARWWEFVACGMAYGVLTFLSFPPIGLWPLVLASPLPLIWAGGRASRPWRTGLLAAVGTIPLWLYEERWLINVTTVGYPLLALYLSVYAGLFVTLFALVRRRLPRLPAALVVPILWTGLEVLRGEVVLTGYAWFHLAHPLINGPWLANPASLLGTYSVSFLAAALAGAGCDLALVLSASKATGTRPTLVRPIAAILAVVMAWVILALVGRGSHREIGWDLRVAIVQTNLPQDNKMAWKPEQRLADWAKFVALIREAAGSGGGGVPKPDVIILPETMFPGNALNAEAVEAERRAGLYWKVGQEKVPTTIFADQIAALQAELGIPMLVGSVAVDGLRVLDTADGIRVESDARYNSAFMINRGAVVGGGARGTRYDKIDLTPFGEVIPYVWRWPGLQRLVLDLGAAGMRFDLKSGERPVRLVVPAQRDGKDRFVPIATPICFEATRAGLCRRLAYTGGRPEALMLVNLSNDGWFTTSAGGRLQHLLAARWRCVELGLPMVRSVNTGVSAHVDRQGKVVGMLGDGRETPGNGGVLHADVRLDPEGAGTLYGRIGDAFGWVTLGGMAVLLLISAVRHRKGANARPGAA